MTPPLSVDQHSMLQLDNNCASRCPPSLAMTRCGICWNRYPYHRNTSSCWCCENDRLIVSDRPAAVVPALTPLLKRLNVRAAARRRATDDERRVQVVTDARRLLKTQGGPIPACILEEASQCALLSWPR
jgi:hypothetical protein